MEDLDENFIDLSRYWESLFDAKNINEESAKELISIINSIKSKVKGIKDFRVFIMMIANKQFHFFATETQKEEIKNCFNKL